ncbi:MAG: Trp family transcriptional regulator [Patescibacteria group bacterium]
MGIDPKLQIELEKYVLKSRTPARVRDLLLSLLTEDEINEFGSRLMIIKRLRKGQSHQKIAKILKVGVATVTRGAKELKKGRFKYLS